jgi:tetratricopeptide (TPR) repeat protein
MDQIEAGSTLSTHDVELAVQHHRLGQLDEAERIYRQILEQEPQQSDVFHLLGVIAYQRGNSEQAVQLIRQAIKIQPDAPNYHNSLGNILKEQGHMEDAVQSYQRALALNPTHLESLYNLGNTLSEQNQLEEALAFYQKALAIKPDYLNVLNNMGNVLKQQGRLEEALESYQKALKVDPDYLHVLNNIGVTLMELGQFEEATPYIQKALALKPDYPDALSSKGYALKADGRLEEAIEQYQQALTVTPYSAELMTNLGVMLDEQGKIREAIAVFQDCLDRHPEFGKAHVYKSFSHLLLGEYEIGWEEHQWRLHPSYVRGKYDFLQYTEPYWDGSDLQGKTLLVNAEQGCGDTIQFCRYVPMLQEKNPGKVILRVQPSLKRLFEDVQDGYDVLTDQSPTLPFDVHIPLMSLPALFKTRGNNIPAKPSYIQENSALVNQYKALFPEGAALKVGIVWAGNTRHLNDRNRSTTLSHVGVFGSVPNVRFYSLQVGDTAKALEDPPEGLEIVNLEPHLHDFADTAAMIAHLDLVISVDTAVAHLAGAMGKPTWTLLARTPDWRWLLNREDSPWYPSMRLFRQPTYRNWEALFQQVKAALEDLVIQR